MQTDEALRQAGVDRAALDVAFGLDAETIAVRNKLLAGADTVSSADALWELYRSTAIPPGAPLVQLAETRRAILWAVAAVAQISKDPVRWAMLVTSVRDAGLADLSRHLGGKL